MDEPNKQETPMESQIVPLPEPEVRLGSLAVRSPRELVAQATELANVLAEVITTQQLFVVIQKRKYVKAEGWLTLGAMLGVVPIEDYCRRLPDGKGFEAKINLIRAKDQGLVGSASAECTYNEKNWESRDSYSLRSMALTRATGKAFRLSFGWIMKLCGYEATPAEEMFQAEGSKEEAEEVGKKKVAELKAKKQANLLGQYLHSNQAVPSVFISRPKEQKDKFAFVTGLTAITQFGLKSYIEREAKGIWSATDSGWMVPAAAIPEFVEVMNGLQCPHVEQKGRSND